MISELSPAFAKVSVQAKPEDLFLKKDSWVQFSKAWPSEQGWASGNLFRVVNNPVVVTFPMSYVLPGGDYTDVNLANLPSGFTTTVLNLYPSKQGVVYQAGVGIKKGDFFIQVGIPAAQNYVYRLGQSFMYPLITDANLKYLGEKTYRDSPDDAPLLFFYFLYNQPYFFLRIYALEGKDFEKCSIVFYINKCDLGLIPPPPLVANPTPQQTAALQNYQRMQREATLVPWYEELTTD